MLLQMETASQRKFISLKLGCLEEQRDLLISVVNDHANQILQMGKAWIEGRQENSEGKTLTYKEISQLIEDTAMFLTQKSTELSDDDQTDRATLPLLHTEVVSSSVLTTASQAAVPLDTLKSVITRLSVIEEAVSSLSANMGKLSEQHSTMERSIEVITAKQSEIKETEETHLQQFKKELETVAWDMEKMKTDTEYLETSLNYDKQIETLEKKVKNLETVWQMIEEVKKTCQQKNEEDEKIQERVKKIEAFGKRIEKLETMELKLEKFKAMEHRMEKVADMKQSIQKLEMTVKRVEKIDSLEQKLLGLEKTTVSLIENIESQRGSIEEVTNSVDANTHARKEQAEDRAKDSKTLQEVQGRLNKLEKREPKTLKRLEKKCQDVEDKYKLVCQIVADRLAPLEQLRGIFNKNISARNENIRKLNEVVKQVAVLMPRVSQLERHCWKQAVGFSAHIGTPLTPVTGEILKEFNNIRCNIGNGFDPKTGMFTAPEPGLYAVCLMMWQVEQGAINLCVQKAQSYTVAGMNKHETVHAALTLKDQSGDNCFGVVLMRAGDTLCVKTCAVVDKPMLTTSTKFSVFLIK